MKPHLKKTYSWLKHVLTVVVAVIVIVVVPVFAYKYLYSDKAPESAGSNGKSLLRRRLSVDFNGAGGPGGDIKLPEGGEGKEQGGGADVSADSSAGKGFDAASILAKKGPAHRFAGLALKGISGSVAHRLAFINNESVAVGETVTVLSEDKKVKITCQEIGEKSVRILVEGEKEPRILHLGVEL